MTDGLPVTVVIGPIVSEVKVITPYKFWGAVHEYDNYNCLSALLSNVWGGSQFVHFALLLALSDTEQHIWQPSYEGDNTIFPVEHWTTSMARIFIVISQHSPMLVYYC